MISGDTRGRRSTAREEHTNFWRLLRSITEGEPKKVVRSIKG